MGFSLFFCKILKLNIILVGKKYSYYHQRPELCILNIKILSNMYSTVIFKYNKLLFFGIGIYDKE